MPISPIKLQRRMAELGRVRLGDKQQASNGRTRPNKLSSFRFTSPSERYITDLAELYGGEARPWNNDGKAEWEVYTTATSIPVIVIKGGLSQWMETWSGGGCTHRCDGERDVEGNLCDPNDRAHQDAKPTTRLSMMLPELEATGAWRLETHGWNAAAEIPAVAELAQFVGEMVPAHLNLVERRAIKDGKTSRFVVPVLDLQIGMRKLREIVSEKAGLELVAAPTAAAAIEAPADPYAVFFDRLPAASSLEDLSWLWAEMVAANLVGERATASPRATEFVEAFKARAAEVKAASEQSVPAAQPAPAAQAPVAAPAAAAPVANPDGTYDAEVVEDPAATPPPAAAPAAAAAPASSAPGQEVEPNPEEVWQQILAAAGSMNPPMTIDQVRDDFAQRMGGLTAESANGFELAAYLQQVTTGAAA